MRQTAGLSDKFIHLEGYAKSTVEFYANLTGDGRPIGISHCCSRPCIIAARRPRPLHNDTIAFLRFEKSPGIHFCNSGRTLCMLFIGLKPFFWKVGPDYLPGFELGIRITQPYVRDTHSIESKGDIPPSPLRFFEILSESCSKRRA